ncbi:chorismate synthase [Suttonella sp. R2A3]|uniref:chorismate synthase n=1 Tax=Suttonella sp. R2A3 TaxID=2908648 RepID=UPI001F2B7754|nr:chorismate synthase [Suttonella sp. R2A3]UJF25179.1 chorismate synthase [Suttonella sp. R2A3]
MSGNSIGRSLILSTFGESHGVAIGGTLDGCPPGIALDAAMIQQDLDRRKPGTSRHVTPRRESDEVELLSGVFEGKTTGTPIGLLIRNADQRSQDYGQIKEQFRPGHADFTYQHKYGLRDYRGGGRASARETAIRVAGGAIAKVVLATLCNTRIRSYVSQIGEHKLHFDDWAHVTNNPFQCPNAEQVPTLERYLYDIRKSGDSIGAEITLVAESVPVGLGEPVFDRLDAELAKALMSINAVKGVSIGDGFDVITQKGSEHRDERNANEGFLTNRAGGILGGISSGQPITAKIAFKPTSSILIPGQSTNIHGEDVSVVTKGRHDPCVALRACPIVEAMAALTLCDHFLRQRGQTGRM